MDRLRTDGQNSYVVICAQEDDNGISAEKPTGKATSGNASRSPKPLWAPIGSETRSVPWGHGRAISVPLRYEKSEFVVRAFRSLTCPLGLFYPEQENQLVLRIKGLPIEHHCDVMTDMG
ncbi:hypothetical protein Bbelb_207700 [Branchiostoma belcheri]|nr:hypothetical protein Bbelb_207700 [Branchiostoma belcheri]